MKLMGVMTNKGNSIEVTRVPTGWIFESRTIYLSGPESSVVFVPHNPVLNILFNLIPVKKAN